MPENFHSKFVQDLVNRGYLYQSTDVVALDATASAAQPLVGYIGFDCTAQSLHVGSLVQIMLLRRLQQAGGKPIVLLGGGTTKIGDPSDKDKQRPILTPEEIETNTIGIQNIFSKFLKFGDGPTDAIIVNNDEWIKEINYIDFLQNYGKHFTINKMIQLESVKRRLERKSPLTFLEFNYMILQSYDFLVLNKKYGCILQMGGSDQWGNIVNGIDFVRRMNGQQVFGITTPILTNSSGQKMGKTSNGAVWLDENMLSAYEFWQYWRNIDDKDILKFFKLFTDLPLNKINSINLDSETNINDAKINLANSITQMVHGKDVAVLPETVLITEEILKEGIFLVDIISSKFLESKNKVKRKILEGAVRLDDEKIYDINKRFTLQDFEHGKSIKISFGKKKNIFVKKE